MRQIEGRLHLHRRLARGAAAALPTQVVPHLFGLIGLDRAGVRLRLGDANRRQSVQNGLALDFQFPCKIVDSNFAHPSLFISSAAFNCSYQPHRRFNLVQLNIEKQSSNFVSAISPKFIIPEIAILETADCDP
jgi:hypothetical protein